ncbi:MAG: TolC family protein [Gallionella sp.]|jgi:cobalt-zinc-cadmium efflux system outer membrane protein
MKFSNRYLIAGAILLPGLFSISVNALPLTLPQALVLAEQYSPALKVAGAQAANADAALDTARAFPNPDVEFGTGNSLLLPAQRGHNSAVTIAQPVEFPGLRNSRRQAAEAGVMSSVAQRDEARINLYAQVKQAFFEVLRRQDEAQQANENHVLLLQIRNRVKLRVEVGESPRYEQVKSDAEALTAENAARSAEIRVAQAKDRLRALLGAPLGDDFEITHSIKEVANIPALAQLRSELLASQPVLKIADAETRRAEARLELERSLRIPQPTLKWSAERHPDVSLWRVSVAMPLPLWDQRKGQVGEAYANRERAVADQDRIRFALLGELDQAYGRYQIARHQMTVFETGLMREAEAALKVAEAAYRYGERGILDYLDAQRVFRSTRMDYLNARYELQFALIDIERLRATAGENK